MRKMLANWGRGDDKGMGKADFLRALTIHAANALLERVWEVL